MKIETQRMHYFQLERQVYVVKCSQCILESIHILLFTLVWHFLIIHAHVFRCRWLEKLTCSGPPDNIKCKPKSPYSIEATLYIHVLYLSNWMMFLWLISTLCSRHLVLFLLSVVHFTVVNFLFHATSFRLVKSFTWKICLMIKIFRTLFRSNADLLEWYINENKR